MKIEKDIAYTLISNDAESLAIYPDSGYTVYTTFNPQTNRDSWYAVPTEDIKADIEKIVTANEDDEDFDGQARELADYISNLTDGSVIRHDESGDCISAYNVNEDEVDEDVCGYGETGAHVYLPGDGYYTTSEPLNGYFLGYSEENFTMYFPDGFNAKPVSIDEYILEVVSES